MAWSYSNNPDASAKDQTRFLIGDTDICDQLLSDEEINWALKTYCGSPLNASIRLAEAMIAKYSRLVDETVGQVSIKYSQRLAGFQALQGLLQNRLAMEDATPYAGGISRSDKRTQEMNTDRVRPDFTKHMMENHQFAPWVSSAPFDFFMDWFE